MRINFQCPQCATPYTLQMPDGIGTVHVTLVCPLDGEILEHAFETPVPNLDGMIWIVSDDGVGTNERLA